MKRLPIILVLLSLPVFLSAQIDSLKNRLNFEADFRFRVEQDWNSRKSDGTFREDRTRLRYRVRAGVTYTGKWYKTGFRIRTGDPRKQQDPQLTLGQGFEEFGTLPIGLEKAYFAGKWSRFRFWLGKNTYPFEKSNELFWSDNVYPEGVFLGKSISVNSGIIDSLDLRVGHFIISASGKSLAQDTYFQGGQAYMKLLNSRLEIFPAIYFFNRVPNIPDGAETFKIDYSIVHVGTRLKLLKSSLLDLEFDYYHNFEEYDQYDFISPTLKDQRSGMVIGLKLGALKEKGDWLLKASYAQLERFSAVDFFAQNDWARWDYSSSDSPDGRLTNLKGIEFVAKYALDRSTRLTLKYYRVEQLIPYGITKETGSRIRLDLDVKF